MDVHDYLARHQEKGLLRFLTAGSVDDGKSTLIGRLLYDCEGAYEDQLQALETDGTWTGSAGAGEIDFALLTDGLRAEREQGITIDIAYRYFSTARRKFIIADAPGHAQYTRNMATGASNCDLAIILVDARHGVIEQTKRHSFVSSLLGIKHVVVAVNKMDAVDWSESTFEAIRSEYSGFATKLEFTDLHFIPLSALRGDNVVDSSEHMPWYRGGPLLDYLETVHIASDRNFIDLRFPVQYVIRPDGNFRGFAGSVASGILRKGDEILALPSQQRSKVAAISSYDGELEEAFPPMAVVVQLEDEIDLSRGDMLVHPGNVPARAHDVDAMIVWMAEEPLAIDRQFWIRLATSTATGMINEVRYRVDTNTLRRDQSGEVRLNDIARVSISCTSAIIHDTYARNRATGSFVIIDRLTNATVACGMLVSSKPATQSSRITTGATHESRVAVTRRNEILEQKAATIWLTGLPKSGKSSIAYELEARLIGMGKLANVLDGSRLRQGVNIDLGFSGDDRHENIRRAASIAKLFNDAGLLTIAAFVSPFAADRRQARETIGADRFFEVHCAAPIEACEARDTEGVYARARSGEISFFSGVSAPYEPPQQPELSLPTDQISVAESVNRIIACLDERGLLSAF